MNSNNIGQYGLIQFYPEHIPNKWYAPLGKLKLVYSVEYSFLEDDGYNTTNRKWKKSFGTPEEAMRLFDTWKQEHPKAGINWLGFEAQDK